MGEGKSVISLKIRIVSVFLLLLFILCLLVSLTLISKFGIFGCSSSKRIVYEEDEGLLSFLQTDSLLPCSRLDEVEARDIVNQIFATDSVDNFGSDEYECSGTCFCDEMNRRGVSKVIPKSVAAMITAVTSVAAYKTAKEVFNEECKDEFFDSCVSSIIRTEVDSCLPLDYIEEERSFAQQENVDQIRDLQRHAGSVYKLHVEDVYPIMVDVVTRIMPALEEECQHANLYHNHPWNYYFTEAIPLAGEIVFLEFTNEVLSYVGEKFGIGAQKQVQEDHGKNKTSVIISRGSKKKLAFFGYAIVGFAVEKILFDWLKQDYTYRNIIMNTKDYKFFTSGLCEIDKGIVRNVFCEDYFAHHKEGPQAKSIPELFDEYEEMKINYIDYAISTLLKLCENAIDKYYEGKETEKIILDEDKINEFIARMGIDIIEEPLEKDKKKIPSCWEGEKSDKHKIEGLGKGRVEKKSQRGNWWNMLWGGKDEEKGKYGMTFEEFARRKKEYWNKNGKPESSLKKMKRNVKKLPFVRIFLK